MAAACQVNLSNPALLDRFRDTTTAVGRYSVRREKLAKIDGAKPVPEA